LSASAIRTLQHQKQPVQKVIDSDQSVQQMTDRRKQMWQRAPVSQEHADCQKGEKTNSEVLSRTEFSQSH
jgi:shikimate kinase